MSNLQKKLESKKVLKGIIVFVAIFLGLTFLFGWVFYNGFFFGIPSSATYLTNFNNLDRTVTWDTFKANHTQIDPKLVQPSSSVLYQDVWVKVSGESTVRPHNYFSFHVSYGTNFMVNQQYYPYSKATLKQPSLLIFLLDQSDRIRGKLYTIQGSSDFSMNGNNATDNTFWFKIPDDMQNQPISIVVEVFGIEVQNSNNGYYYNYGTNNHDAYSDTVDDVYGSIPSPQSNYLQQGYVNMNFLAYDRVQMHTPTSVSILDLAGYSELIATAITGVFAVFYLTRNRTKQWWTKNKVYVIIATLFLVTYIMILVVVGMIL
jgi:hypothetical protein